MSAYPMQALDWVTSDTDGGGSRLFVRLLELSLYTTWFVVPAQHGGCWGCRTNDDLMIVSLGSQQRAIIVDG
jgi:hypothetical protein